MEAVVSVSTRAVSARDGFEWWTGMVSDAVMPVSITSDHADRFRGAATSLRLGRTEVSAFAFSPMSARRSPVQIRRADPEDYFLFLVHGSPIALEQRRGTALLHAGDMALFDSSHPLACEFQDHGRQSRVTLIRLPRAALPLPTDRADGLLGAVLSTRTGSGALLRSYLAGLRTNAANCSTDELRRLGEIGLDLSVAFLAARLDTPAALLPAETRQQVLLARINAFIDHHLSDPDLSPITIAAHHHISVRHLHTLFRQQPASVGATIHRLRLERGRADLADPRLRHRRIGETSARWGFRHPADFSRAFRRAYGISPSDYRHLALLAPGPAPFPR
ncbi:helix-turn-helix domain-containing protein [Streptomyces sp. P9(2023)]|uniref:AraC-like ligand-binding domain-containing protein n=1 Tax=Streptomyces sp. P9(2023) TaxID=3064394 RepID=UPI0028F4546E|nr:helix-turn-helix domain-containing protein [Streptomyces sp. P9(2023)]MDT9687198.1 helix-turn-helix domain-containing protein [Streptomyces sp. P9(2023)]